jgi:dTDP-4-dehydrorhamnose reductase
MEQRVLDIRSDAVMLRAEWMYDYYLKKSNYYMNILNAHNSVNFSSRQYRGVTYVKEVVENLEKLVHLPGGAYNMGSETTKSMFEITTEFLSLIGKQIKVNDVAPKHNLWMNCDKAKKYGITFSSVEDGLKKCAKDHGVIAAKD